MMTISRELQLEKQIDRACSAQAPDMLPKLPPSPEEKLARRKAMQAKINSQFPGRA